ncbi:conserved protein of unknown function [Acidithiobacillus ferrivorans]|uniref:Phosphate-starvation-inducible E-like protein n=1 Tax=Acidithiobacillus ferrivorans TaxID=160808 RepID=A0A060UL32_9PROT|nr:phosphate-starvation-inducible PsiE family protein [Acidithiobacillus ferrivorans]CDQ09195.1 conserved hypothetical protein [Acidithiobacillus ferrivorans]SMH64864.1 conserved protein of unknown function [Acidithiobacillus ferrivorans]
MIYVLTKKALNQFIHLVELVIAWSILALTTILIIHLIWNVYLIVLAWTVPLAAINVKGVISEAFDIMIMLEIAQIFIRLEDKQRLNVVLILDTAILFAVRESILGLYSHLPSTMSAEIAASIFVTLRIGYSFKKSTKHAEAA